VEATASFAIEGVDRGNDFRKTQVQRAASIHPAMLAAQVAAVGDNQASNERRRLPEKMAPHDESQAERTRLRYGSDGRESHRAFLRLIREVTVLTILSPSIPFHGQLFSGDQADFLSLYLPGRRYPVSGPTSTHITPSPAEVADWSRGPRGRDVEDAVGRRRSGRY